MLKGTKSMNLSYNSIIGGKNVVYMSAFDELLWKLEDQGTVDTAKNTDTEEQGA